MAEISILPRKVFDVAQTQLQTSLNYLQRGIDLDPTNLPVRLAYQYSYCYQGEIWLEQGESEKAKDILKQCILQAENLHIKFPENLGVIRSKASSGRTLANAYSIEKKYAEAIADSMSLLWMPKLLPLSPMRKQMDILCAIKLLDTGGVPMLTVT